MTTKKLNDKENFWLYLRIENDRLDRAFAGDNMSHDERLYRARHVQRYIDGLNQYSNLKPILELPSIRRIYEKAAALEAELLEQYASSNTRDGNLVMQA